MSRKIKRLEKLLDKELYEQAKAFEESGEFGSGKQMLVYIEFYEFMVPSAIEDYRKTPIGQEALQASLRYKQPYQN